MRYGPECPLIIEPDSPSDGVLVAFVLEDGAPVELMQFDESFRR